MRIATLATVAFMTLAFSAGSAGAFMNAEETTYDLGFEADGRGSAGIFFSFPVSTDAAGAIQMSEDAFGKSLKTYSPLEVTAIVNTNEVTGDIQINAASKKWGGDAWDLEISLVDGKYNGLKELELQGTMLQVGDNAWDVDLTGYAIYNMQRVTLDMDGTLVLNEFSGPQAL